MKVSELGEFGLIDRLAELLAAQGGAELTGGLAVGIGDDAAVWKIDTTAVIATTDTLVADVHYLSDSTPAVDLGWKAIAVNVSDIAAMGGTPDFALVTLGLATDPEASEIDELYRGMGEAAEAYGLAIAGGDIVRAPAAFISVTLVGHGELDGAGEPRVLRRNGAQDGDLVAVTGQLGGASGGLRALREGIEAANLTERHLRPRARLRAGHEALAAGLRCAIDVSDGLLQDLGHVCEQSRLGATVWRDRLPVDPELAALFEPEDVLRCAVAGGDDYELLVTGPRDQIDALAAAVEEPVTVIGEMVIDPERKVKLLDESGRELDVPEPGWDHLRGPD